MRTTIPRRGILWAAILALSQCLLSAQTVPPASIAAEPEENGEIVYLQLPPETQNRPATHLLGLRLNVTNTGGADLNVTRIRIQLFYAAGATTNINIDRSATIEAGKMWPTYLKEKDPFEAVQLADPPPGQVRIEVYFEGYRTPAVLERRLAAYRAPTPTGSYLFPGNRLDLTSDQVWSHIDPHTGGSQFFAYDLNVSGWNGNAYSRYKSGTDGTENSDSHGWGVPVYAMADGTVLWVRSDYENNPVPKSRAIQRMAESTAGTILPGTLGDLKVTRIKSPLDGDPFSGRVATVASSTTGNMELTVWDIRDDGSIISKRGSVTGGPAQRIATAALSESRVVTATRPLGGTMRLAIWDISDDGLTVAPLGQVDVGPVQEMALVRLADDLFATAVTAGAGFLRVNLWKASDDGLTLTEVAENFVEVASAPSIQRLSGDSSGGRLAVSFRDSAERLKLIAWDYKKLGSVWGLQRGGNNTADRITTAALVARPTSTTQLLTAMRTLGGNLRVLRWTVSEDGTTVTPESSSFAVTAGAIQAVAAAPSMTDEPDTFTTCAITADGNLTNLLWTTRGVYQPEATALELWGTSSGEPATLVSIEEFREGLGLMTGAIRTGDGHLKLITWRLARAGGNEFRILHGNCRMVYAHFLEGSVNREIAYPGARVKAGQYLGRMGNSGQSTGPHTHIHSELVDPALTVEELIENERLDIKSHRLAFRPIPFRCATARRLSSAGPSGQANIFSPMNGHGMYFTQFAIRPDWKMQMYVDGSSECAAPQGFPECIANVFGPYILVNQALSDTCSGPELFIRANRYNETVVFNRGMIVRSYDGPAVIGSP